MVGAISYGNHQVLITGKRQRIGANAALQWRPAPNLEFTPEGQHQRFRTAQQQYSLLIQTAGTAVVPRSVTLFSQHPRRAAGELHQSGRNGWRHRARLLDENKQIALNGQ